MKHNFKGVAGFRPAPFLFIIVAVGLVAAALLLPVMPERLTVSDARAGKLLLALPIEKGENFQLRYTHSVNLSDVTDTIEWTGTELICRSTLFTAFGAGIPVLADGIGTGFSHTEDGFEITGIDKPEKSILIMLQTVPNHRLLWHGQELSLMEAYGSGTLVELKVRHVSLLELALAGQKTDLPGQTNSQ